MTTGLAPSLIPIGEIAAEQAFAELLEGDDHLNQLQAYSERYIQDQIEDGISNLGIVLDSYQFTVFGYVDYLLDRAVHGANLRTLFKIGCGTFLRAVELEADQHDLPMPFIGSEPLDAYDNNMIGLEAHADVIDHEATEAVATKETVSPSEDKTKPDEGRLEIVFPAKPNRWFFVSREAEALRADGLKKAFKNSTSTEPLYVAQYEAVASQIDFPGLAHAALAAFYEHNASKGKLASFERTFLGGTDVADVEEKLQRMCFLLPAVVLHGMVEIKQSIDNINNSLAER